MNRLKEHCSQPRETLHLGFNQLIRRGFTPEQSG